MDEMNELLDTVIYKEIAAQSLYSAAEQKAINNDSRELLRDLMLQEEKHAEKLKGLKGEGLQLREGTNKSVTNLRMSEYLVGPENIENAEFQDILIFAIKREQEAIDFYSRMTGILRGQTARELCQQLVNEELSHKLKLETLYDELVYQED